MEEKITPGFKCSKPVKNFTVGKFYPTQVKCFIVDDKGKEINLAFDKQGDLVKNNFEVIL